VKFHAIQETHFVHKVIMMAFRSSLINNLMSMETIQNLHPQDTRTCHDRISWINSMTSSNTEEILQNSPNPQHPRGTIDKNLFINAVWLHAFLFQDRLHGTQTSLEQVMRNIFKLRPRD
jgi:hypothetical protein